MRLSRWPLALSMSIVSCLTAAVADVDPQAASVNLEPDGALDHLRLEVGASIAGPVVLHPDHVSFLIRRIGTTDEMTVKIQTEDKAPAPCTLKNGSPTCSVSYRLNISHLAPGAYELVVQPQLGLVQGPNGDDMPIAEPRIGDRRLNLYIPTAAVPPPAVGTHFLATSDADGGVHFGTIWTLVRDVTSNSGMRTYTFQSSTPGLFPRLRNVDVTTEPYDAGHGEFLQLVDDPAVRRLRNTYVGKPLWTYGRYVFDCRDAGGNGASAQTRDRAPLYIGAIYRVAGTFIRLPLGTDDPMSYCQGGCHQAYHVFTDEPLFVIMTPDDHTIQIIPPTVMSHPWMYRGPCVRSTAYFADDWAIERVFTLDDPHVVDPEWSPQARKDLLAYQFDSGMTYRMVAFAAGYPSLFGTRDDLEKLISWEWYPGSASDATYYFDESGTTANPSP